MKNCRCVILLFLWCCYSCALEPRIAIPTELRTELKKHHNYRNYIYLMNQAIDTNDPINLSSFLSINYFNDPSTGAEHGKILLKILIQKGDSSFFKALKLANHVELSNIKAYMLIGIDNQERDIDYYITRYPKSFAYLKIDHW